jgi:hypothetical protein
LEIILIRPSFLLCAAVVAAPFTFPSHLKAQTVPVGLQFTPLDTPCRAVDTRLSGGPIAAGTFQSFNPAGGACSIPATTGPIAYAMNVTVVPHGPLGYLSVWPTGQPQPVVSTLNSPDGRVKANAAIVSGGNGGEVSIYVTDTTDLVLDVTGYFSNQGEEVYVPVGPCRLVDTRTSTALTAGIVSRLPSSNCFTPPPRAPYTGAGPYPSLALNITAVPKPGHNIGYVTVWGSGSGAEGPPLVSNLNDPTGTVVANAAIIPLSNDYGINAYSSDDTDLVIDVTGYFANQQITDNGLSFYPVQPCRVVDTRETSGAFSGQLNVPFTNSPCQTPSTAQSYVVNATVVPSPPGLGYLTLWPFNTSPQPLVSTLNAGDGQVTSNMAIIGSYDGSISSFATSQTQLILDVTGYFAPLKDTSGLKVAFMGDDSTQVAVAAVQSAHPNWINAGGPTGETTTSMLARFQTDVLNKHPDVVVIMAGQYDIVTPGYGIGPTACGTTGVMCQNIGQMFQIAYNAGVKYFIESTISCSAACQNMIPALGPDLEYDEGQVEAAFEAHNRLMVLAAPQSGPPTPAIIQSSDLIGGTISIIDGINK